MEINSFFFLHPMKQYGVRELSRLSNSDTKTVMKYLKELVKRKIVLRTKEQGKYPYYEANRNSYIYRHEKSETVIKKIIESGLIEYLEKKCSPFAIVLFGSIRKGTYHSASDIDLFIQAPPKKLNLHSFEKKIGYPLQLLYEENLHSLSKGLLTNIYNGIVLAGKIQLP